MRVRVRVHARVHMRVCVRVRVRAECVRASCCAWPVH